ncbi:chitinase [Streptomyces triticagri]|uniref:Chitinase n=2 Tax=Streptomyces triticagri TaxID=2293568 RepID=A0A372M198_9ACTN|nr:chitinase [Streptomyces triticagri]RFU84370.1 chitinase [Streptomyces triticagri]
MVRMPKKRLGALLTALVAACALLVVMPMTSQATVDEPAKEKAAAADFVVSEAQFNEMFPNRNSFYTYSGLTDALSAYPEFATTGDETTQKREAAAFLANVSHETGGLVHIVEENQDNYPHYCDDSQPYGCPAGNDAYYGRGPVQLSWNFNYKAAGDALGIDLLNDPWKVEQDAAVAWKTGLWYWNTQSGPGTMTPHDAMVNGAGFGETIRAINGSLECDGGNPGQVQSRIDLYQRFVQLLGTTPGDNLSC